MKDKILLCIPGTWRDRPNFIERLFVGTDGRLVAAGNCILDRENKYSCEFNISPFVEDMDEGFRIGSQTAPIAEDLLTQIGQHTSFLSLYSNKDGTSEALAISEIALAALDVGGLAVRVEGSKRASDADQWRRSVQQAQKIAPGLLYHVFVWAFVCDGITFDTIGMPFLGHPDISIEAPDFETANAVYNEFAQYLLYSEPEIFDGQTIGFEDTDGVWRMTKASHTYIDDPDIDFSRGMWRLRRVSD